MATATTSPKERLKKPGPLPIPLRLSRSESDRLRLLCSQTNFELDKKPSPPWLDIDAITRNYYVLGRWVVLEEHDDGNSASDFSSTTAFGEFGGVE